MGNLAIRNQLQVQQELARTPAGRDIREQALTLLGLQPQSEFMQCLGCGLLGPDIAYAAGCPNCNAKDVVTVKDANQGTK